MNLNPKDESNHPVLFSLFFVVYGGNKRNLKESVECQRLLLTDSLYQPYL